MLISDAKDHLYGNKLKRPSKLVRSTILCITSAIIALTIYIGTRTYHKNKNLILDHSILQQLAQARSTARALETYFKELALSLSSALEDPSIVQMTPECLESFAHIYAGFLPRTSIRRIDENGILRFIYPQEGWRRKLVFRTYEAEPFFKKVKDTGRPFLSRVVVNEQGESRIRFILPVYDFHERDSARNSFKGVLAVSFSLETINTAFISPVVSGQTGYAWLINHDGFFLAHYDKNLVGQNAFKVRAEKSPRMSYETINRIQSEMLEGKEGIGRYLSGWHRERKGKIEKIVAYSPAHVFDKILSVAVCTPTDEVDRIISTTGQEILFAFGFALLILTAAGSVIFFSSHRWSYSLEREVANRTKKLKESSDYLCNLINSARGPIFVWDREQRITLFNKAFTTLTGWTEVGGKCEAIGGFYPEDSHSCIRKIIESAPAGERPEAEEFLVLCKDGQRKTILWGFAKVFGDDGKTMIATIAQGQDITELKQTQKELNRTNRIFNVLRKFNQILVETPEESRLLNDICRIIVEIGGFNMAWVGFVEPHEEKGVRVAAQYGIHEIHFNTTKGSRADDKWYRGPVGEAIKTGKISISKNTWTDPDFTPRSKKLNLPDNSSCIALPLVTDGKTFGTLNIYATESGAFDPDEVKLLTELADDLVFGIMSLRIRAKQRLEESEKKNLISLVEQSSEFIGIGTLEGKPLYINKAGMMLAGLDSVEEMKTSFISDYFMREDIAEYQENIIPRAMKDGIWQGEFRLRHLKSGGPIPVELTQLVLKGKETAEPVALAMVARDISYRKEAERQKNRLETQLRQLQKMEAIGSLAGGIAHDFNNILGAILTYTELSQAEVSKQVPVCHYLNQVFKAINRAKGLVQQILTFSRHNEQKKKPLEIGPLIKEVLKLLRASLPSTIKIEQNISEKTGMVLADPIQIHQVLMNICTNSKHAMREHGGILSINLNDIELDNDTANQYPDLLPGHYIKLEIGDTGCGMNPRVTDRIFDPYYTTKPAGEGTGLGLSVVYGIVKEHEGAIKVYSEKGVGTTVQIFFPMVHGLMPVEKLDLTSVIGGNERILFVDDEKELVESGKLLLQGLGYEVISRVSSIEALEVLKARQDTIDLVITDLTMPNMTGVVLVKEIRKIRPDIPVILCTGFSQSIDSKKASALGVSEVLMKPILKQDIAEAIRRVFA